MKNQNKKSSSKRFIVVLLIIFFAFLIFLLIKNINSNQTAINPTSKNLLIENTPAVTIPADWKAYSGYGLSFSYPSNWRISAPNAQFITGDEMNWSFDRAEDNNMTSTMSIIVVKDYVPLPDVSDPLRSYFYESDTENRTKILKEEMFQNRRAIRHTTNFNGTQWESDTLVIEVPEISGVLYIYFPDSFADLNLSQAVEKYFSPFLHSLQISPSPSLWASIKPVLTNESLINTSSWKKYQGKNFSFMYPNTWQIEEKKDQDFADLINVIVTKSTAETMNHATVPQIIIGTPIVFSRSGSLCGNQTYGECLDMGQVALKIKEKTYWGTIIDKNVRDENNRRYEFYPSFYVFRITPDRVPSQPSITAMFKDLNQGQEITNILSTIEY